ncbi:hypothetical protein M9458_039767, partial [Cirrhinus mrigala]
MQQVAGLIVSPHQTLPAFTQNLTGSPHHVPHLPHRRRRRAAPAPTPGCFNSCC